MVGYNFMLRVELLFDLPCKSVRAFTREMEYELIQEGGLNDYVHMRRKPISKPFYFEIERYIGVDYIDPLPVGAELVLPVLLFVSRNQGQFLSLIHICLALVLPLFAGSPAIAAAPKTLQLKQAQNMALSNNTEITKTYNEILLKEIQYTEAVKEIKAKVKNLTSFRWTPRLSFKFPEQLDMSEEYDMNVKPLNLQTEIDILRHQMNTHCLLYTSRCV